ncbi:MAG: hypothetical protein GXX79_14645 [Actinomycetales bacterium]|nr:hypothetical protein [Actinomycetales bacterium]
MTRPGTMALGRSVVARCVATAAVAALGVAGLTGCDSETQVRSQKASEATIVPTDRAKVPAGWTVHRGPGFTVAVPPEWKPMPDDQRAAPSAALEVGVPFTGQPTSPAVFFAFVEREQVGPLVYREPLLRAQLEAGIPGVTLGDSTRIEIAGSSDALYFDVLYEDEGGTSVLGTKLEPTVCRQRELIIETPGLPKYGFRYGAPQDQFDEQVWQQIARSIVVTVGADDTTTTATSTG